MLQLRHRAKTVARKAGILPGKPTRKVCFVITNRIHYARQQILFDQLKGDPELELQLIVGGSALNRAPESVVCPRSMRAAITAPSNAR